MTSEYLLLTAGRAYSVSTDGMKLNLFGMWLFPYKTKSFRGSATAKKLGVKFLRKNGSMVFEGPSSSGLALGFLCLSFFGFFLSE